MIDKTLASPAKSFLSVSSVDKSGTDLKREKINKKHGKKLSGDNRFIRDANHLQQELATALTSRCKQIGLEAPTIIVSSTAAKVGKGILTVISEFGPARDLSGVSGGP